MSGNDMLALLVTVGLGIIGIIWYQKQHKKVKALESFELEFYKRCYWAGLGDMVKTEEEIQKAAEIAQKLAAEEAFSRELKKHHLKAKWLNKRLCNGEQLCAQENEQIRVAEAGQRINEEKAEEARRKAEEARRRVEEAWRRAEEEQNRMYLALPCRHWKGLDEYTLEKNRVRIIEGETGKERTYWLSRVKKVELNEHKGNYYISISTGEFGGYAALFPESEYADGGRMADKQTPEQMLEIYTYLVKYSAMPEELKSMILRNPRAGLDIDKYYQTEYTYTHISHGSGNKDASVVGRAAAGWAIAGPAGGVIGALSAVDKNNRRGRK